MCQVSYQKSKNDNQNLQNEPLNSELFASGLWVSGRQPGIWESQAVANADTGRQMMSDALDRIDMNWPQPNAIIKPWVNNHHFPMAFPMFFSGAARKLRTGASVAGGARGIGAILARGGFSHRLEATKNMWMLSIINLNVMVNIIKLW